jgi:hypothetical protein
VPGPLAPSIFMPGASPVGAPRFPALAPTPARLGPILRIAGVTRDSTGVALAGCTVHLIRTVDDVEVDVMVSSAAGVYAFVAASPYVTYYIVAYKAGSPDVAGTTANTLAGV